MRVSQDEIKKSVALPYALPCTCLYAVSPGPRALHHNALASSNPEDTADGLKSLSVCASFGATKDTPQDQQRS